METRAERRPRWGGPEPLWRMLGPAVNAHIGLLRSHLEQNGHATLHEAPDPSAYGWLDGRAHEITMPFAITQTGKVSVARRSVRHITHNREQGHHPGGPAWAFAKLYGHLESAPEVITVHLPALFQTWADPPEWWFVRYLDPESHLRLRFRLSHHHTFGAVSQRVSKWAAHLRHLGLVNRIQWDTYYPETGRYGTGATMSAAETVFAADSAAALTQIELATAGTAHPHALTVASFVNMATTFTGY
jgi:lantibiotic biosynthesis protein